MNYPKPRTKTVLKKTKILFIVLISFQILRLLKFNTKSAMLWPLWALSNVQRGQYLSLWTIAVAWTILHAWYDEKSNFDINFNI